MSNYVERAKKRAAIREHNKIKHALKSIKITTDKNKQTTWFLDYVSYEMEKKKYTPEFIDKLRKMPYKRYLLTPHWDRVKRAAYGRFGRACFACSDTKGLIDVHHLSYENRGHENMEDLMLLCRSCHEMVHETMKQSESSDKQYANHYTD